MNYSNYLFGELLKESILWFKEMEYDLFFSKLPILYDDYEKSEYNVDDKSEYKCMQEYIDDVLTSIYITPEITKISLNRKEKSYVVEGVGFSEQKIYFDNYTDWNTIYDENKKPLFDCQIDYDSEDARIVYIFQYVDLIVKGEDDCQQGGDWRSIEVTLTEDKEEQSMKFNEGKPQYSLLDFKSLEPLVKVMEYGVKKYAKDNWKKSTDLQILIDSSFRHLIKLNEGIKIDKESGLEHAGHIMANMMFYIFHSNK